MRARYTFGALLRQINTQKREFWRANLYGLLATLSLLPVPLLIPLLIDGVLLKHPGRMTETISVILGTDKAWVLIVVILFTGLFLRFTAFFFNNKKTFYALRITQRIAYLLRRHVLRHLERLSLAEYETLKSGGIATKTIQDVEQISSFAGQAVMTVPSASLMLLGIAAVLFWMNWVLALLVFLFNPLFLALSRVLGRKTAALLRRRNEAYELYQELLNETMELFIQMRAGNQERALFGLLKNRVKNIEKTSLDYGYKAAVAHNASTLLTHTVVDLFRALGVAAVAYSDLSIGMMIAFLFYLSALVQPVQQLTNLAIAYRNTQPALERINLLLSLAQEPHYPQEADPFVGEKTASLSLRHVRFAYANGTEVLHDISLHAEAGQKIALIGPSGSGKSTIAQLMVGFYPPRTGRICYGGVPIEKIGLPVIRENVALMLQQALFFNDTIRMNLTLSRNKSDEEIYEALKTAQLETFVRSLEQGLETPIGKNGIRLSGGQRQRLAIARLILSDPKIVIFDEATSALDTETELHLYRALTPFLKERTTVIIAHRTTTIMQADYVYLIEGGRVKAQGSYRSLQNRGVIKEDFDDPEN